MICFPFLVSKVHNTLHLVFLLGGGSMLVESYWAGGWKMNWYWISCRKIEERFFLLFMSLTVILTSLKWFYFVIVLIAYYWSFNNFALGRLLFKKNFKRPNFSTNKNSILDKLNSFPKKLNSISFSKSTQNQITQLFQHSFLFFKKKMCFWVQMRRKKTQFW